MAKRRGGYVTLKTPTGDQRWRIAFRHLPGKYGDTDWGKKTIWLDPDQDDETLAHTIIHEATHVATGIDVGDRMEDLFNEVATDSVEILRKLKLLKEE